MLNLNCKGCEFSCNDEHSSGCGAPFPIDHCEVFNKAMEEESKRRTTSGYNANPLDDEDDSDIDLYTFEVDAETFLQ